MRKGMIITGTIALLGAGIAVLALAGVPRRRKRRAWLYLNGRPAWEVRR